MYSRSVACVTHKGTLLRIDKEMAISRTSKMLYPAEYFIRRDREANFDEDGSEKRVAVD